MNDRTETSVRADIRSAPRYNSPNGHTLASVSLQLLGGREHAERSVPAEELEAFNTNIVGPLAVIAEFAPPAEQEG